MRLLIVTPPHLGHVLPMRSLARALAVQGHELAWASGPDALQRMAGEPFMLMHCGASVAQYQAQLRARWPDAALLPPREHGTVTRRRLFDELVAPTMRPALERILDTWQPDAVLHDPLANAVPSACDARGLPRAMHAFGWPLPPLQLGAPASPPMWSSVAGATTPAALGIEIVPALLRAGVRTAATRVIDRRPCEANAAGSSPLMPAVRDLLARHHDGPLVLASFGTVFHTRPALRRIAGMLAALPLRSIVLGVDRAALDLPENPRQLCLPWLEQTAVLPSCDAVVCHGGAGTVLGALAHGRPLVIWPQGADHFRNSAAVQRADAGRILDVGSLERDVKAAIVDVLDGECRAGAQAAAEAIRRMPDVEQAAQSVVTELNACRPPRRAPSVSREIVA